MTQIIQLDSYRLPPPPRPAKVANSSAVSPASRAVDVDSNFNQRSAGMLSLWDHFFTVSEANPASAARASADGHSLHTSRNDNICGRMQACLGQSVLELKGGLSIPGFDVCREQGQFVPVAGNNRETEFKRAFIERTRHARLSQFKRQVDFLQAFPWISQGTWKTYETKNCLPHHLVAEFCAICEVDIDWLYCGKGKGPAMEALPRRKPRSRHQLQPISFPKARSGKG